MLTLFISFALFFGGSIYDGPDVVAIQGNAPASVILEDGAPF